MFSKCRYQTDDGLWYDSLCQPELLNLRIGGVRNETSFRGSILKGKLKLHKSKREPGVHARYVWIKFVSNPPSGYAANVNHKAVIFFKSVFDGIEIGETGTYLGSQIEVVAVVPENRR